MLKPYEEYKKIDLPWLAKVPSHWDIKRNKNVLIEKKEVVGSSANNYLLLSLTLKGVIARDMINAKGKFPKDFDTYKVVEPGNLIFCLFDIDETPRAVGLSSLHGMITGAYDVFQPVNINGKYLYYYYLSIDNVKGLKPLYTGLRKVINIQTFLGTKLPMPRKEEQDQIVRFLDWKLAKINKLIRAKKKQIELLNEQKQVIINNAVTKGLDPNVPMKDSGIEWIGTIPEHWKVLYLSQTATEQSISNKDIHNQNLLSLSYGKIINKDINTTDGLLPASFDTYQIVHNGNIILRLTDLQNDHKSLRVGLATQTGIITSAYTCLLPRKNVIPEFLYLLLHSYDICKVFYGMGGGVRQSIGFDDIRRLLIPVPPLKEQKQIVDFCYAKSNLIEGLLVSIEKEILLLNDYRTRIISDVVTGKVDVRGIEIPEYEADSDDLIEDELEGENAMDDEAEEAEVE
ncbi:MAG: restriction endonuclease subunit S [Bacillota bacterium]